MMINITPKAKEKIEDILKDSNFKKIRVSVKGGGCAGFQYSFSTDTIKEQDILIDKLVLIDPISSIYLEDVTIDYKASLMGENFIIENPNIKTTCGCGVSFGF